MKPSFLNSPNPLIVSMILKDNPEAVRYHIKNSIFAGADAMGIQLERMKQELRTEDEMRKTFAASAGRPLYITNYRSFYNGGLSDEELMDGLIKALEYGGTLADIMGDTYDRSEFELTKNQNAIDKQKRLIEKIHNMGKEVIMSSHIFKYTPAEKILEIALEQQSRGADIVKIVSGANSDDEQMENLRITNLLKHELEVPFIFLSSGTHTKIHRMVGPMLGCFGWFAVLEHDEAAVPTQPTIHSAKMVRDNFDFRPDILM